MRNISNEIFYTILEKNDNETGLLIEKLVNAYEERISDEWEIFGYKYIGGLKAASFTIPSREHELINNIFAAIRDQRNGVTEKVTVGVKNYLRDTENLNLNKQAIKNAIVTYLESELSRYDADMLMQLKIEREDGVRVPITKHLKWNIAIVNPWPGSMSAEAELVMRNKQAAEDAGLNLTMLSNFGHILEEGTQKQTKEYVDSDELDFVISTHYDTHKCLDAFYYHTLWNPPEIPLNLDDYPSRITDNYIMYDDFLIYDDGGMKNHLNCILMDSPRDLDSASMLVGSFPSSCVLKPNLNQPTMFYCGMNWERVVHNSNRHEGLFKLLDNTGKVKFFGPDKVKEWGGIAPWEGYKCYQHPIPFDGFSILKEINNCGICLVLSSDIHRRAGAATNRLYEACAAGAVIISDDNPFMLKYFSDAALFVQYNKNNPKDTFEQLMEKYEWIISHKEEALKLANRAQEIFLEKFALDKQLLDVIDHHAERKQIEKNQLYAKDEKKKVVVSFILNHCAQEEEQEKKQKLEGENSKKLKEDAKENSDNELNTWKTKLDIVIKNVKNQYYRNIQLIIAVDRSIAKEVQQYCKEQLCSITVLKMDLFDFKGSRILTDFQALRLICNEYDFDYIVNMRAEEFWFYDHITTLVRTIEDKGTLSAVSGRLIEDNEGYRRAEMFRSPTCSTIFNMAYPDYLPQPGQIMFAKEAYRMIPEYMDSLLDGYEHYMILGIEKVIHNKEIPFSFRMTMGHHLKRTDERGNVLEESMQIRLIRDALKRHIPDGSLSANQISNSMVSKIITDYPIKRFIAVRICRIMLRIMPQRFWLTKKIQEKYNRINNELIHYFG